MLAWRKLEMREAKTQHLAESGALVQVRAGFPTLSILQHAQRTCPANRPAKTRLPGQTHSMTRKPNKSQSDDLIVLGRAVRMQDSRCTELSLLYGM